MKLSFDHSEFNHTEGLQNGKGENAETSDGQLEKVQSMPFKRSLPKVGRNELCPCESGKKYKHCHGKLTQ